MSTLTSPTPTALIFISISLSRPTHSYTHHPVAPTITFTLTSSAPHPITIFTYNSPLDPKGGLTTEGYTITDLSNGEPVKCTGGIMVNRPALRRVRGGFDEKYFLTIPPGEEVRVEAPFGHGRPVPWDQIKDGKVLDEDGEWNERGPRRSRDASGVTGLKPGRRYSIGLNVQKLGRVLWAPVDREEILVDDRGVGSYVQDFAWVRDGELRFGVVGCEVSVEE